VLQLSCSQLKNRNKTGKQTHPVAISQINMSENQVRNARIFAIVNRKGGVAKTTTAINLAHGLSRKLIQRVKQDDLDKLPPNTPLYHYRDRYYYIRGHVLLVDFDPQGHCAVGLGIDPGPANLGALLLGEQNITQCVVSTDRAADGLPRPNLWLLPATDHLEQAKEKLRLLYADYMRQTNTTPQEAFLGLLEHHLSPAYANFDFIVVDCPPLLDAFTRALYQFADATIIPIKLDFFSYTGTHQQLDNLRENQLLGIDVDIHTLLPTFFVSRHRLDTELIGNLKQRFGNLVGEPIPRSQTIAESSAEQQTLFEFDANLRHPATLAYQQLVDRVYFYGQEEE